MSRSPRVLVAPDSFKGSLGQVEVAAAIARGVRSVLPAATVTELPLADGGEGWLETIVAATAGRFEEVSTAGPLGEPVEGRIGLLEGGRTAVVEVATASGLHLVEPTPSTFRRASSAGTGALIARALDAGARRVLVGLGGSATTDGGAGLGVALGARLLRADGDPVGPGGEGLAELASVDLARLDPRLAGTEVLAAADVDNPLLGPTGAAAVYGPQKGAGPADVGPADAALGRLADLVEAELGRELRDLPGAGAAGGLGFGLVTFCGARLAPGIEIALDAVGFDDALAEADLVITGEGRIDPQTLHGKAVAGVARRASDAGVPAFAIGGALDPAVFADWESFAAAGLAGVVSTVEEPIPAAVVLDPEDARRRLVGAAERLARTFGRGRGPGAG